MTTSLSLPFLYFFRNPEDILLFYYILARVTGLLVVSPLLSQQTVAGTLKFLFAIFLSLLFMMVLQKDYHEPNATLLFQGLAGKNFSWFSVLLNTMKELGIGYLLGFCFTLIFEATLLAGEVIDTMTGFATASSFDPISATTQALLGPLLMLTTAMIILSLDLHHEFIRVLAESFTVIPFGNYAFPPETIEDIVRSTGLLFIYALKIAAIPFVILACGTIGIGFVIRTVPEYNPLLTGLPLRVLIVYYSVMLAVSHLPPLIRQGFIEFDLLSRAILYHIGGKG